MIGSLLGIVSLSPLHIGVGRGMFDIDLPIARDEFSIPYIPGSGIKGALRARFRLLADVASNEEEKRRLRDLDRIFFGQMPEESESIAGSVIISDAILLAIPVRTLYGLWAYATSAFQLKRFIDYYILAETCRRSSSSCCCSGDASKRSEKDLEVYIRIINEIRRLENRKAIVGGEKEILVLPGTNKIVMNEDLVVEVEEEKMQEAKKLIEVIKKPLDPECSSTNNTVKILLKQIAKIIEERLVIVSDSIFRNLIERSIITQTRVRLNYKTKTVEAGPWTEENLPQFTILTSLIIFTRSRRYLGKESLSAEEVRKIFIEEVLEKNNPLVLGGHETIGRGLVVLKIC